VAETNPPSSLAGRLLRSPFAGHTPFEKPSHSGTIGVVLHTATLASVVQISTWPAGIDALRLALGAAFMGEPPQTPGDTVQTPAGLLMHTGPEEFLLVSEQAPQTVASLRRHVLPDIGSVTDLSHARCRIRIEGGRCAETLGKLFALDLRASAFPPGECRMTGHHHVPCLLHRLEANRFDAFVFTTYAFDQLATLIDAALEYGVALR
jgi:heterotetrameric sarcosine oxidase gamma subunit